MVWSKSNTARFPDLALPCPRCSKDQYVRDEDEPIQTVKYINPKRMHELARPLERNITTKYVKPEWNIEKIACTNEFKISDRLNMLALPYVRSLVHSKSECRRDEDKGRKSILDAHIKQSLDTIYTRLAGYGIQRPIQKRNITNGSLIGGPLVNARDEPRRCFSEHAFDRSKRREINNITFTRTPRIIQTKLKPESKPSSYSSDRENQLNSISIERSPKLVEAPAGKPYSNSNLGRGPRRIMERFESDPRFRSTVRKPIRNASRRLRDLDLEAEAE